jgi:hypothetical protein
MTPPKSLYHKRKRLIGQPLFAALGMTSGLRTRALVWEAPNHPPSGDDDIGLSLLFPVFHNVYDFLFQQEF